MSLQKIKLPEKLNQSKSKPVLGSKKKISRKCKLMLIMGTSGVVYPAADVPYLAHSSGAKIVEINIDDTPFTSSISDFFFRESASKVLPRILEHVGT